MTLLLMALMSPALQPSSIPRVQVSARIDRNMIRLCDYAKLTFVIEGASPLRIDIPAELLVSESAASWQVIAQGSPSIEALPAGVERWTREYRLIPYPPIGSVQVGFTPWKVNGKEIECSALSITVTSGVIDPRAEAARPPTGIEELLSPMPVPYSDHGLVLGILLVTGFLVTATYFRLRKQRCQPTLTPTAWALAEMEKLEADTTTNVADRLTFIVRGFIERREGILASGMTTAELKTSASVESPLIAILERCDYLRFTGQRLSTEEVLVLTNTLRADMINTHTRKIIASTTSL